MNQVMVVPFPGRGHINPMLNLCNILSSRLNRHSCTTIFTIVVTEEWLGFLDPDPEQENLRFATIPNVLPSELHRGSDVVGFLTAANTKMERPFVEVLDQTEFPVTLIIAYGTMGWPFDVANKRNFPVAMYWPMSASTLSVVHHVDLLESHHHLFVDVSERGIETIDYIPGLSSLTVADIPMVYHSGGERLKGIIPNLSDIKANYILISTIYELEYEAIDGLRATLKMPVYTSGPNIPYSQIGPNPSSDQPMYLNWLKSKTPRSVLYVSFGSFRSISGVEMAEIAYGLTQSGVNFLWVARGETSHVKEICGENGMVVEWCDQLRVLLHSSIGGFWTHCGWNSVKESLFSGVPMLAFPISLDQPLSSKMIVKDWKIGWNTREKVGALKRDEIAKTVRDFMDSKSAMRIEVMERVKAFSRICQESVGEAGSVNKDIDNFVRDIAMN